jgi:uncharacterized protein YbjT (DUF2867 family)
MKVFVAGATGQTGQRIVSALVSQGISTTAFVRDRSKATSVLPEGVDIAVGDVLQPRTIDAALDGCTAIICATGATPSFDFTGPFRVDYEGTKNLVDAAKRKGINRFILVSSLCVSQFFHPLNLFWLVLFWKKQAEAYLCNSGLAYTIVRPGGLKNEDNANPVVMSSADTLFEGSIPRTKVADTCVAALSDANAVNTVVEIVARPEAPKQPFETLFAGVSQP